MSSLDTVGALEALVGEPVIHGELGQYIQPEENLVGLAG